MLFSDVTAVYCEKHETHKNTLYGQNEKFLHATPSAVCSYHWALNG